MSPGSIRAFLALIFLAAQTAPSYAPGMFGRATPRVETRSPPPQPHPRTPDPTSESNYGHDGFSGAKKPAVDRDLYDKILGGNDHEDQVLLKALGFPPNKKIVVNIRRDGTAFIIDSSTARVSPETTMNPADVSRAVERIAKNVASDLARVDLPRDLVWLENSDANMLPLWRDKNNMLSLWRDRSKIFGRQEIDYRTEIRISKNILNDDGSSVIDFGDQFDRVTVVDNNGSEPAMVAERLSTLKPPPVWVSRVLGCCVRGRPPSAASAIAKKLRETPFVPSSTHFLSLVVDTATENAIAHSSVRERNISIDPEKNSHNKLRQLLRERRGETVIIMGHVERGKYVTRDSGNKVVFEIPIIDLRAMAKDEGVQLVDIGCSTGSVVDQTMGSVGVIEHFRTTDAVERTARALDQAQTLADLFEKMSDEKFNIVIDDGAFAKNEDLTAGIFSKIAVSKWLRVGEIGLGKWLGQKPQGKGE